MSKFTFCQQPDILTSSNLKSDEQKQFKKSNVSVEISASLLSKTKITRDEGNYNLQTYPQTAFDIGINYLYNINKTLVLSTGFHAVLGTRNFYNKIPPEDLRDFYVWSEPYLLEDKDIWGSIRIPLLIEKKISTNGLGLISIKTGLSVRYSGFMSDEGIVWITSKPNGEQVKIFEASFSAIHKPWVTFIAGASKLFTLKNYNILSLGLTADISTTYFFKGTYKFKIPSQPVTSGTYEMNGSSIGLSLSYIFTGANKRLVRNYQKE